MKLRILVAQSLAGPTGRQLWIILSRLAIYGLVFAAYLKFLPATGPIYHLLLAYGVLAIGFLIYVVAFRYHPNNNLLELIIGVQILFELAFEAILISRVGSGFSPLSALFVLTIVSASMVYQLVGTLLVATAAGLFYAAPVIYDLGKALPSVFPPSVIKFTGISGDEAFYTVFLHLCLFYITAFISGYMAENLLFASKELRKIRLETDEILENMRSGVITIDPTGKIVYFNKAAGEILGIPPYLAKNNHFRQAFYEKCPELYFKIELALTAGYVERRGEIEIKTENGIIPVGISTSLLIDQTKALRGVIAIFQDLTEAKRMERRLRAADRLAAIGQLAAGIAHEIRNPLASISGSAEVLRNSLSPTEQEDKRLFELILKESERLNRILTEFLRFARVSGSGQTRINLVPLVEEVIEMARGHPVFQSKIKIEFEPQDKVIYARGDTDHHKQLLWNLLLNAGQAMADRGGIIKVSCGFFAESSGRSWTRLQVADSGSGIPAGIRDKVFSPFFSTKSEGTGLGLAIVARIVESLEGKITFDTGSWGTVFTVWLPPDVDYELRYNKLGIIDKV